VRESDIFSAAAAAECDKCLVYADCQHGHPAQNDVMLQKSVNQPQMCKHVIIILVSDCIVIIQQLCLNNI